MKKLIIGITAPNSVDLLHGQLNYIKKCGFDVALLAPKDQRVTEFCVKEDIRLIPIEIKREISFVADVLTLKNLITIFRKERPDIINLGTPKISLLGMMAGWITRVPYRIYTCRGFRFEHESGRLKKLLIFFEKLISRCAHRVYCISKSVRDLGLDMNLFPEHKTYLIGKGSSNGVDLQIFSREHLKNDKLQQIKENYQLSGYFVFGFVGRLVDRKGLVEMLSAFDEVYQANKRLRLLVVGRPFWDQIGDPSIIDRYENHPGVIMAGFQPIELVPYFLSLMDVFLLPAHWEGFGNVFIQAAAMGLPIIGTDVTGCRDAVSDNFNGILVNRQSPGELVEAMLRLLDDDELRERLGKNGIQWSQNFHPQVIWDGYIELYNEEPLGNRR